MGMPNKFLTPFKLDGGGSFAIISILGLSIDSLKGDSMSKHYTLFHHKVIPFLSYD